MKHSSSRVYFVLHSHLWSSCRHFYVKLLSDRLCNNTDRHSWCGGSRPTSTRWPTKMCKLHLRAGKVPDLTPCCCRIGNAILSIPLPNFYPVSQRELFSFSTGAVLTTTSHPQDCLKSWTVSSWPQPPAFLERFLKFYLFPNLFIWFWMYTLSFSTSDLETTSGLTSEKGARRTSLAPRIILPTLAEHVRRCALL